jgi:di/tricarboxylate transporter
VLSFLALVAVILAGCFSPTSVGFLSIALSFLIGRFAAGMQVSEIAAGFPSGLFISLTGITLLFSQTRTNGTLEKVVQHFVRLARGSRGLIPIIFFLLAAGLASTGVGNFAATALLAPVAMSVAGELGISGFLMALMLVHGASAGAFSPVAPTGIVARDLMERVGLQGTEWSNFFNTFAAQSFVALIGFTFLGGLNLFRQSPDPQARQRSHEIVGRSAAPLNGRQRLTLVVVGLLFLSVAVFRVEVGMGAFVAAAILSLLRATDDEAAVKSNPWGLILMVCGVTVLIEVLHQTGGMDLFTEILATTSGPAYITGIIAIIAGAISVYSSSVGVVLPAFLPTIPGLLARLGGGNPLMVAYAINVGAHLVDASPLSPLGALCLACAAPRENRTLLFRKLMAWGWSMVFVGGLVCQLFFGYR